MFGKAHESKLADLERENALLKNEISVLSTPKEEEGRPNRRVTMWNKVRKGNTDGDRSLTRKQTFNPTGPENERHVRRIQTRFVEEVTK